MDREPDRPGTGRFGRRWRRAGVRDDGDGSRVRVERIARGRRRKSWDDVVAVLAPDRWTDHVAMVLTDGREAGTPIPEEWAQRVAQIGGVPLQQRQRRRWHHGQT